MVGRGSEVGKGKCDKKKCGGEGSMVGRGNMVGSERKVLLGGENSGK